MPTIEIKTLEQFTKQFRETSFDDRELCDDCNKCQHYKTEPATRYHECNGNAEDCLIISDSDAEQEYEELKFKLEAKEDNERKDHQILGGIFTNTLQDLDDALNIRGEK